MSAKNGIQSLRKFAADLRRLPRVVGAKVAAKVAPELTSLVQETFNQSEDPYGNAWKPGSKMEVVTLKKSGNLYKNVRYVAVGTILRLALGTSYAKYQVGTRRVAPRQGQELPETYTASMARTAVDVCREEMRAA